MSGFPPANHLRARFAQHPRPHARDQTGVLRNGNEVSGGNRSVVGMVHANESFEGEEMAAGRCHRLVEDAEISQIEGFADQSRHFSRAKIDSVHIGVENRILVFVLRLASVHRHVGQTLSVAVSSPCSGNKLIADAGGPGKFVTIQYSMAVEARGEVLRHPLGFVPI